MDRPIAITATLIFALQPNFARAEKLPQLHGNAAISTQLQGARCAAFGAGFVAIAGSSTCVHISGHVRVGYTWGARAAWGTRAGGNMSGTIVQSSENQADPAPPYDRLRPPLFDAANKKATTLDRRRRHTVPVQFSN